MNDKELKQLCENAAVATTGKRVVVKLVAPVTKNFDGETYHVPGGCYVIRIKPELSDANFIWVLCHELGHVKLNHNSDINPDHEPGSVIMSPLGEASRKVNPVTVERENDAQSWGDKYLQYAEENYQRYSGFTKLEQQLRALSGYLSPELQERVNKAAIKGADQATEFIRWQQEQMRKGR